MPGNRAQTFFMFTFTRLQRWRALGLFCVMLQLASTATAAEQLVIDYIVANSPQRLALLRVMDQFAAANPDVKIKHQGFPQEQYKKDFIARLQSDPADLAFWYAGERLRDAVRSNLLSPLDAELVTLMKKNKFRPATIEGTRLNGEVFGFPLYYYVWGLAYRKSLFQRLDIQPPATWNEFLQVCERLKAAGVVPLGLGAKSAWPAAGWFDYLDLRINGIDFHRKLLRGEVRFTDPKVRKVFDVWGDLLRKGYFLPATVDQEWERVLPYLYRNHVGMTLMGSFIAATFPTALAADMGFFAFPSYSADMPDYEEAPLDILVLPTGGVNRSARNRFLNFLAESGALSQIAEADQTFSPKADPQTSSTLLGESANVILSGAAGLTYFFDRDAKPELVAPAYDGLRLFLKPPYSTEQAVQFIEKSRAATSR